MQTFYRSSLSFPSRLPLPLTYLLFYFYLVMSRSSILALPYATYSRYLRQHTAYVCSPATAATTALLVLSLKQELSEESSMVFVKGDANYRRLIGDRLWPTDTPFSEVASYFPTRLCALRTLKAELG